MRRFVAGFAIFALLVLSARADVIRLKHGGTLEGRIVRESAASVTIRMADGSMDIPRDLILEIVHEVQDAEEPSPETTPPDAPAREPESPSGRRSRAPAAGAVELETAIARGDVKVEARGGGLRWIHLVVSRQRPGIDTLHVSPGTLFVAPPLEPGWRTRVQDMVCTAGVNITLSGDAPVKIAIPVCCADLRRRTPYGSHVFTVGGVELERDLCRVVAVLAAEETDFLAEQVAVWVAANDASYGDMGRLQGGIGGGSRKIVVIHAVRGMMLCEKAGIDISARRIGEDDFVVVGALCDRYVAPSDPARVWAMNRLRKRGYRGQRKSALIADILARGKGRKLLVVACDVAAQDKLSEAVVPLKSLLDETSGDGLRRDSYEHHSPSIREKRRREDSEAVALWAARALEAIGVSRTGSNAPTPPRRGSAEASLDESVAKLERGDPSKEYSALRVLSNLNQSALSPASRRRAADALLEHLESVQPRNADLLGRALARYGDVLIPRDLLEAAKGASPQVRRAAARALGKVDRPGAAEALVGLLDDTDASVRKTATDSLRGRQDAAKWLTRNALHPRREVRQCVVDLLLELEGRDVEVALGSAAAASEPVLIEKVLDRLGELEAKAAAVSVSQVLWKNPDADVRVLAARTLARIGGNHARSGLLHAQRIEKVRKVRIEIERALKASGG